MTVLRWALPAAVLTASLSALNGLLADVQVEGRPSGAVESLASGFDSPPEVVKKTRALLEIWTTDTTRELTSTVMWTYLVVDTLFIVFYTCLIVQVWRWLARSETKPPSSPLAGLTLTSAWGWRALPVALLAASDVVENGARMWIYVAPWEWLIITSWVATWIKLGALAFLGVVAVESIWRNRGRWWPTYRHAVWRLRVPAVAVFVCSALFLFDLTGQVRDLLRNPGAGLTTWMAAAVLGWVVWFIVWRLVLTSWKPKQLSAAYPVSWFMFGTGVVGGLIAWNTGYRELAGSAIVLGVVGFLGMVWEGWARGPREELADQTLKDKADIREADAKAPEPDLRPAVLRVARGLAITPMLVLAVAFALAYTPVPVVYHLDHKPYAPELSSALQLIALCFVTAVYAHSKMIRRSDQPAPPARKAWFTVLVVGCSVAGLVGVHYTAKYSPGTAVSALPLLILLLALASLLLSEAQRFAETIPVPKGLVFLGFSRTPVALLLVLCFGVSGFGSFNDGTAHDVRRAEEKDAPDAVTVQDVWMRWKTANCLDERSRDDVVPLVFVASQGGGQRAAYWSASTLTELFKKRAVQSPCGNDWTPADSVFALGGASGGGLGTVAWAARPDDGEWYRESLAEQDFLTGPFISMLTVDLPRALVGFDDPDRAERLERGWERAMELDRPYLADAGQGPLLVLTGTQVENGCRLNISALRLTTGGSCADGQHGANAPVTSDLLDYTCDHDGTDQRDIRRSTAALLAARFPYVSPSGHLYHCGDGARIAVVDGGYSDNTGIDAALEVWRQLEPSIAFHNESRTGPMVVPVFVVLDNHYRAVAKAPAPHREKELWLPLRTQGRANGLDAVSSEQRARQTFQQKVPGRLWTCALNGEDGRFLALYPEVSPGLEAPLAWTLSEHAVQDLDGQRRSALRGDGVEDLFAWFDGRRPC